jgi:ssDNA-binding Zn-finger/Zn-ribbon topoisomerase 1
MSDLASIAAAAAYPIANRQRNGMSAIRLQVVPPQSSRRRDEQRGQPICPECQGRLVQRSSRKTGDFLSCESCRHTQGLPSDRPCPSCDRGTLIVKRLPYGPLTECDQYPVCKYAVHEIEGACNRCRHTCAATLRRAARDDDAKRKGQAAASRSYRARVKAAKDASAPQSRREEQKPERTQTIAEIYQAGMLKRYEEGK